MEMDNGGREKEPCLILRRTSGNGTEKPYFLKLNRTDSCLEIYERAGVDTLWEHYPIREDFDASEYVMYRLLRRMPCMFGGDGRTRTPEGIFEIEKVSPEEYISPYHPKLDAVKFFGYLVVFEDYFIHSDLYSADVETDSFREAEPISAEDTHTQGCIRVKQEDLDWLVQHIPAGVGILM